MTHCNMRKESDRVAAESLRLFPQTERRVERLILSDPVGVEAGGIGAGVAASENVLGGFGKGILTASFIMTQVLHEEDIGSTDI